MKAFRLSLVMVAASLALAACNYRNEAAAPAASSQASLPDNAVLHEPAASTGTKTAATAAIEQPSTPVDAAPASAQPMTTAAAGTDAAAPDSNSVAPDANAAPATNTMGAQPASGVTAAAAPSDGVAAPTELQRFLEESSARAASKAADQPATKESAKASDKAGKPKAS